MTEEDSVGYEAAGNTVFTELSVATSRVHLVSPVKSLMTAVLSATKFGTRPLLRRKVLVQCAFAGCLNATRLFGIV